MAAAAALMVAMTSFSAQSQGSVNLLTNPGFEGPMQANVDPCTGQAAGELGTPNGWTPFFRCRAVTDPPYTNHRPEFGQIDGDVFDYRVRSRRYALKYFNFFARNESAGVYQRVPSTIPGQHYQFELWVQLWTSNCSPDITGGPSSLYEPGNLEARVCIDTDGGPLEFDTSTVCSAWTRERAWDRYAKLQISAPAASSSINVVLNTRAEWPVKHNDAYADDAALFAIATPITAPISNSMRTWIPLALVDVPPPHPEPAPRCPAPVLRLGDW
jgi:hypothetical protein